MHAANDADTCLRRGKEMDFLKKIFKMEGQCEPLGGKSIWSSFSATVNNQKPILLVQAGLIFGAS